jgi:uncharacterized protein
LDALGAIGIARTFAYGGFKGQPVYDPQQQPKFHESAKEYLESETNTINHFHEKLLLLKNRMKTRTGRDLAESRHQYMENYLSQFYQEWNLEHLKGMG